jgi:hypothetical protein
MKRFIEDADRGQSTLFPDQLEDWVSEDNPVRVVDVFVDELDLGGLGFGGVVPEAAGRPCRVRPHYGHPTPYHGLGDPTILGL